MLFARLTQLGLKDSMVIKKQVVRSHDILRGIDISNQDRRVPGLISDRKDIRICFQHISDACILKAVELVPVGKTKVFSHVMVPIVSERLFASPVRSWTETVAKQVVVPRTVEYLQVNHQLQDLLR